MCILILILYIAGNTPLIHIGRKSELLKKIRIHTRVLLLKNNKNIYRVDLKFEARSVVAAAQQADPAQSDIVRSNS